MNIRRAMRNRVGLMVALMIVMPAVCYGLAIWRDSPSGSSEHVQAVILRHVPLGSHVAALKQYLAVYSHFVGYSVTEYSASPPCGDDERCTASIVGRCITDENGSMVVVTAQGKGNGAIFYIDKNHRVVGAWPGQMCIGF